MPFELKVIGKVFVAGCAVEPDIFGMLEKMGEISWHVAELSAALCAMSRSIEGLQDVGLDMAEHSLNTTVHHPAVAAFELSLVIAQWLK